MKPLLYVLILLLCLTGCKKPVDIPEPNSSSPINGELTPEQKMSALTKVQTKFAALDWSNQTTAQQQLLAFLRLMPEFEKAGISESGSNVWARFPDDELVMLVNNRQSARTTDTGNGRKMAPPIPQGSTGIGLPASTSMVLMNAMGNYYLNGQTNMSGLNTVVSGHGYKVDRWTGSIEKLKNLQGVGVFYFSSHGGNGIHRDSSSVYGLWTTDNVSAAAIKASTADLKEGNLGYMVAFNNQDRSENPIVETHFAITSKFVQKYMSFPDNSLIYIDACESFTDNKMVNAFLQKTKNTGVYFGWTGSVGDYFADRASNYFFDRTLGANVSDPERPNQRPFDPLVVLGDMTTKGLTTYVDGPTGKTAKLVYRGSSQHMTFLRPSISYMDINEIQEELDLVGFFGDDPGTGKRSVLVNGTEMDVITWSVGLIICKIPVSGPGSAGDVVVKVGDIESNVRRLTEWRGTINYRRPADGTLYENMNINFHIRADVASFRSAPGQAPRSNQDATHFVADRTLAKDSELWYSYGGYGKSTYENCTMEITRPITSGGIPWVSPNKIDALIDHFTTNVEQTATGFTINLSVFKNGVYSFTQTSRCPGSQPAIMNYNNTDLTGIDIDEFTFTLDSKYDIKEGNVEKNEEGVLLYNAGSVPIFPVTLKWGPIKAQYPPIATGALRQITR